MEEEPVDEARDSAVIAMAREQWHKDGEIEIDDNPKISYGDDDGAYVQAWAWVSFTGTPLEKEE